MSEKIIQFPKSREQILQDAERYIKTARFDLSKAERAFRNAFYTGMLEMYEEEGERAQKTGKQGGFRRKLKAAGLQDVSDSIIDSYLWYQQALDQCNELRKRNNETPWTLKDLFEALQESPEMQRYGSRKV